MRKRITEELGIEIYDIYGLTEIYGPGIGISCSHDCGMHYWDDYIYIEIIDPVTGEVLPDGELGEIVITTLVKEGLLLSVTVPTTFPVSFLETALVEANSLVLIPSWDVQTI